MAMVVATSVLGLILFFLGVPYREPRHLLPPLLLGLATLPAVFSSERSSRVLMLLLFVQAPLTLFYWGRDLAGSGGDARHTIGLLATAFALFVVWRPHRWKIPSRTAPLGYAIVAVALILIASALGARYEITRFEQWRKYWSTRMPWGSREARADLGDAARVWSLVADSTRVGGAVIAYSGSNLPYPLRGYALRNEVRFVPRNGQSESWHYDWNTGVSDAFRGASADAWLSNVRSSRAKYLCVFRESAGNDPEQRFPVEAQWAEERPEVFRAVDRSAWARVYAVIPP
jgi:hypothetical protein